MEVGDIVVRKSYKEDITFKIIDTNETENGTIYILKGINLRLIADSPEKDLIKVSEYEVGDKEKIFNEKVNSSINNILKARGIKDIGYRNKKIEKIERRGEEKERELTFGRPGRILHVDGDGDYMEVCMKTYKQLGLSVVGKMIKEQEQPEKILDLVKSVNPDIVIITGHDSMVKDAKDYTDINNYKNSKYYVKAVAALRAYKSNYDDLVIFAGACQSCYEAILDAGANFASSPKRVLIHCLDPLFVCEKVAYTNIEKVVSTQEALQNTISGTEGIGGLQTRGKYREGFPKSPYI